MLRYLIRGRGLTRAQIRSYGLGYKVHEITIPVRRDGELVNFVRHPPGSHGYYLAAGHRAAPYPPIPPQGPILLCGGIFDALIGRQHGLPTVTTCLGAQVPGHLLHEFAGKRVCVCFDVGEEGLARIAVERLARARAEVWSVDLPLPESGDDLADWFVRYHKSRRELLKLIRGAKP